MHPFDALGQLLVEIQLLRAEQWRQISHGHESDADLSALLDRLQQLSAWWTDAPTPALTPYQRKCIKRLSDADRAARLRKMLRWNNYLVLDELGEGGMGIVYKCWDLAEKRFVAIKRIKGSSVETHRRFRREARIQRHLHHPCIAQFLQLARFKRATLLILEYIEGRTLAAEVKARGPIPWQEAARWTLDILRARLKIIHRDLKPSNISLPQQTMEASAKLLDMGLAKCLDPSALTQSTMQDALTAGNALLGTYEYMAPEQWRGAEDIVLASDIYSLGCTLFFTLSGGRPPFVADSLVSYCNAHTNTPPPRLATASPAMPDALDALLQQMLAKNPAKRGSAAQLLKRFESLLGATSGAHIPLPDKASEPKTPAAKRPAPRPSDTPLPAEDRFTPFPSSSRVPLWGLRTFVRALFISRGGLALVVFLLLLGGLAALGLLMLSISWY
jgi:serine/threonine protein kinase